MHCYRRRLFKLFPYLVVFFSQFKIALGILAHRAYLRSFLSNYQMAADTAFPHTLLCLLKYLLHLDIMKQLAVTLFVGLLYCAYFSEKLRHLRKTFLIGIFCKTVHS